MIVAEPALTPVTTPVDGLTVATPVALLLQVPPLVVLANVVVAAVQTVVVPVIDAGVAGVVFTVTLVVTNALPQVPVTV